MPPTGGGSRAFRHYLVENPWLRQAETSREKNHRHTHAPRLPWRRVTKKAKDSYLRIRFQDPHSQETNQVHINGAERIAGIHSQQIFTLRMCRKEESNSKNKKNQWCASELYEPSAHEENMGVCRQSDLNTKQHLGEHLGLSLFNSPPASQRHTGAPLPFLPPQLFPLLHEKQGHLWTQRAKAAAYQLQTHRCGLLLSRWMPVLITATKIFVSITNIFDDFLTRRRKICTAIS